MPIPARRKAGTLPAWHGLPFHRGANGCAMNRFIRKSWYTLTEAADYLTQNRQGDAKVTASDVLQFAMDGEITLSIRITQTNTTPLLFAELAPGRDLSKPETEQSKELRESNKSHPLSGGLVFEHKAFEAIYLGTGCLNVDVWDIAGGRFFATLWDSSKSPDAPGLDRFDSAISKLPYRFVEGLVLITFDRAFAVSVPIEEMPDGSYLGLRISELSQLLKDDPANTERQDYPPQLEALTLAWRKNWKNADPTDRSTCPKKESVKDWLMGQGFSAKNADAGATIIKPQWATDKGW